MRMEACGQTITHLAHWMQTFSSQTGISRARLRFSYWAVAVGKEPSQEKALTGSSSPRPAAILPRTCWTYLGALRVTPGANSRVLVTWLGTVTSKRLAR